MGVFSASVEWDLFAYDELIQYPVTIHADFLPINKYQPMSMFLKNNNCIVKNRGSMLASPGDEPKKETLR